MRPLILLLALAAFVAITSAFPARIADQQAAESVAVASSDLAPASTDLAAAGTGYGHHGRVQIKVYRGPSSGYGYDSFAPWGYWVRQPEDAHGHYH